MEEEGEREDETVLCCIVLYCIVILRGEYESEFLMCSYPVLPIPCKISYIQPLHAPLCYEVYARDKLDAL